MNISVIILTLNAEQHIGQLLTRLRKQTIDVREILVVDSMSTDATSELVRPFDVQWLQIPRQEFDHGGTRTMAAKEASGDILIYFTQDAIPADKYALERLVIPFDDNPKLAATYGRQLPNTDATPFSRHLRLFNYPETSATRSWEDRNVYGFKTIFISNSFAAYRKSCLAEVNFFPKNILFGEDTCTLARILKKGYSVQYVSEACVYHSHNYTIFQDARRYFDIGVLHCTERKVMRDYGVATGAGRKFVRSEISFLFRHNHAILIAQSVLRNVLKYIAYALGKRYQFLPRPLAKSLSMHRYWWQ